MGTVQNSTAVLVLLKNKVPVRYFTKYIIITYTGIVFERHKRFKLCHLYFEVRQYVFSSKRFSGMMFFFFMSAFSRGSQIRV